MVKAEDYLKTSPSDRIDHLGNGIAVLLVCYFKECMDI